MDPNPQHWWLTKENEKGIAPLGPSGLEGGVRLIPPLAGTITGREEDRRSSGVIQYIIPISQCATPEGGGGEKRQIKKDKDITKHNNTV